MEKKNYQNAWNAVFTVLFILFIIGLLVLLNLLTGELPTSISVFDLVLISLATFRLIRLFVYDKITQFIRDWFVDVSETFSENKEIIVTKTIPEDGPRRTLHELLACPWCFGVWCGAVIVFFYYATPLAWPLILILAVSGIASFFQITTNLLGWHAEYKKIKTKKLFEE